MPTTLATFISRLRQDLHDEDNTAYRWTDEVLQRHIETAVREFSLAVPLQQKSTLQTAAGSRDLDASSLTKRVYVDKVEYPVDKYPPEYVSFRVWKDMITILVASAPGGVEDAGVYWGQAHTVDANGSTIPAVHEDIITAGAGAYAAVEWANFAPNRVNVGGSEVGRDYLTWGQARLAEFHQALRAHGYQSRLRSRQMVAE